MTKSAPSASCATMSIRRPPAVATSDRPKLASSTPIAAPSWSSRSERSGVKSEASPFHASVRRPNCKRPIVAIGVLLRRDDAATGGWGGRRCRMARDGRRGATPRPLGPPAPPRAATTSRSRHLFRADFGAGGVTRRPTPRAARSVGHGGGQPPRDSASPLGGLPAQHTRHFHPGGTGHDRTIPGVDGGLDPPSGLRRGLGLLHAEPTLELDD